MDDHARAVTNVLLVSVKMVVAKVSKLVPTVTATPTALRDSSVKSHAVGPLLIHVPSSARRTRSAPRTLSAWLEPTAGMPLRRTLRRKRRRQARDCRPNSASRTTPTHRRSTSGGRVWMVHLRTGGRPPMRTCCTTVSIASTV